jgi:DNA-directed RNA polymerase omega subunit
VDSKYTLVHLAARRAREINAYYHSLGEGLGQYTPPLVEQVDSNKPLSIALEEVALAKIVVQDVRLRLPNEAPSLLPLPWRSSRSQLAPKADDGLASPAAFVVPGREALEVFLEFGGPFPGFTLEDHDYSVQVEARLGHRKGWRSVLTFTWRAGRVSSPAQYLPYSNAPHGVTRDVLKQANATLDRLHADLARDGEAEAER